jgi:zinc transport system substrate-binding protein
MIRKMVNVKKFERDKVIGGKCIFKIFIVTLLISVLVMECSRKSNLDSKDKITVAVSILPLVDFTREIGGERVNVEALIQPGYSPHTYEPTVSQLETISKSKVLVLNGIGLEFWAEDMINASNNSNLRVIRTAEGLEIIGEHNEGGGNPHIWLDPIYAKYQVEKIKEALIDVDPEGSEFYENNAERYLKQLDLLDEEIKERISKFSFKKFISFHGAFSYFAKRYGLEEAAVIEKTPGAEPSPAEIARIINLVRSFGAKAIFAEPQFPSKPAKVIAEESGAKVIYLNPLGLPPDYKYIDLMRYNIAQLEKAFL